VLITVGIVSLGLLAFRLAVAVLPVYETHASPAGMAASAAPATPQEARVLATAAQA
jgi:hypothetical protein